MLAFLAKRPGPAALTLLILAVLGVHGWLLNATPQARYWGDEPMYAQNAAMDAASGETSLLPGKLPFRTRPEFSARLMSNFEQGPGLGRSVTLFQMLLLGATLWMLFAQARLLGLRPGFAVLAAALLGCFPWFGFHVHSLWPEVLHAFLTAGALWGVLWAMAHDRIWPLVPAGVCIGLALFTKGVLQPFALLFGVVLAYRFWQRGREAGKPGAWKRGLLAPGVLLLSTFGTLAPQLLANEAAGHGYQLAANRWWNLELGLCAEPREGRSVGRLQREYFETSAQDGVREAMARERTLAHLRASGPVAVLGTQWTKLKRLVFEHDSSFERSLGKMQRWGPRPPAYLGALAALGRGMWFAFFALGGLGGLLLWRRSSAWFLVSAFSGGFLAAAFLIPLKVRFLMPLMPFLCLLSAGLLQLIWERYRPAATEDQAPQSS